MPKPIATGFFAYPSQPPDIGETIRYGVRKINERGQAQIRTWEDCKVGGKAIIQEICRCIDESDIFCADLCGLNANVMFELGYAIAKNKRTWLTLDPTVGKYKSEFEQMRILTTIGYAKYTNSSDINSHFHNDQPYADRETTIFEQLIRPNLSATTADRLLYLKSRYDTEASVRISNEVELLNSSGMVLITDDPKESASQSLTWYGDQVYSARAVLCHLTSAERTDSRTYNARYALVAGLAFGMDKDVLMIAPGDFLAPVDYRDLLVSYQTADEAEKKLRDWITQVENSLYQDQQGRQDYVSKVRLATELKSLQLGDYVAENEAEGLVRDYFVETDSFWEAHSGNRSIFLGRKGTGKTANFLKLSDELSRDKRNLVCQLKPVAYEMHGIVELLSKYRQRDSKGYAVESLWKFLLYTEIASTVVAELRRRPDVPPSPAGAGLMRLMDEAGDKFAGGFSVRLERCVEALSRVAQATTGVEASRLAISEALHQAEIPELRNALGRVLRDRERVAVLIDNLDKPWDRETDLDCLAEFLLGLLSATDRMIKDFHSIGPERDSITLTPVVFLRSDIFQRVAKVAREPDKILYSRIDWNDRDLLLRVIEERFTAHHDGNASPEEMWRKYFCQAVHGRPCRRYFLDRILPRPRDLVYFVKTAVSTAVNRRQSMVREEDILSAEKQYSDWVLDTIVVENNRTISNFQEILYEFIGCKATLTDFEVQNLLHKANVAPADTESVIRHLCTLSFLGVDVAEPTVRFADEPEQVRKNLALARRRSAERNVEVRYRIHPAFCSSLEISEA